MGRDANETQEVLQDVGDHIEEALAENPEAEVSLVGMAQVLERLGPVESYGPAAIPKIEAAPPAPSFGAAPGTENLQKVKTSYLPLVHGIWWASLVASLSIDFPIYPTRPPKESIGPIFVRRRARSLTSRRACPRAPRRISGRIQARWRYGFPMETS